MPSFSDILSKPSIFKDRNVLSPHFIPESLPFRESQIERIMTNISPALKGQRPRNIFIYGTTGTGKTSSVKNIMEQFDSMSVPTAKVIYLNCRVYNSRYRALQKVAKSFIPGLDKSGFGISFFYEKLMEYLQNGGIRLIIVIDEVDMVKDLDDLLYTLTRINDELTKGGLSLIGISNKLSFKDKLDPRSRSTLYENEMVFHPYSAVQLQKILRQRADMGFSGNAVSESAINLAAAIAAQESGDARYALKLLLRAGEIADEYGSTSLTEKEVEEARKSVDEDIAVEAITTLPEHQQLVLYGIANLSLGGSRYTKLGEEDSNLLISGEVYEEYSRACKSFNRKKRSARWYREYLNDLEMLGLITMVESGKGMRGRTRLIKIDYPAQKIKHLIEKNFSIIGA